jgi:hypothetical protein
MGPIEGSILTKLVNAGVKAMPGFLSRWFFPDKKVTGNLKLSQVDPPCYAHLSGRNEMGPRILSIEKVKIEAHNRNPGDVRLLYFKGTLETEERTLIPDVQLHLGITVKHYGDAIFTLAFSLPDNTAKILAGIPVENVRLALAGTLTFEMGREFSMPIGLNLLCHLNKPLQ